MFTPRTTAVKEGTAPYFWNVPSVYQCTWYAFGRALEVGYSEPCWFSGSGSDGYGSYTNAKEWLKHVRSPWEVKGADYTPVAGDIAVYDGQYGHVIFMETSTMYSEYRSGDKNSFANGNFKKSSNLLGFLHYPYSTIDTVERNANVNQIETTDESLRIRTKPSLNGEVVGHVQVGYYNVLSMKDADGYTWYEIAKNRWCANIGVTYLPANDDILKELESIFNQMRAKIEAKESENKELKADMASIDKIAKKWL